MKLRFKIQDYQTDAVNSIIRVFDGQPYRDHFKYNIDMGSMANKLIIGMDLDVGFANPRIELAPNDIFNNIKAIQYENGIPTSKSLSHNFGAVDIDVEMETGTGKTYVYIKSMFELNKRFGFSKFIVVVPSIAIREGVRKTFDLTQDHFMEQYGKKARYFIYNSKKLDDIEQFSNSNDIQVMIINIQAFNARGADARKIYEELDSFQSRKPIDVIAKNNPIIILDEPQKMGGAATQESLQRFNPLFSMNFSATHKVVHNTVYALDALDAFNKKLVKKIEVKGFTVRNLHGTNGYLYLQEIVLRPDMPPQARIEFEAASKSSGTIKRELKLFRVGDNIGQASNDMAQYSNGFVISDIDPANATVTFINGEKLETGNAIGDVSEMDIRRIQIRETIRSHFEKEKALFSKGIKVLSLFFIDEVAKYRQYDENGNEINGIYGQIFEEEYVNVCNEYLSILDDPYVNFLKNTSSANTHRGYFSIDKKGHKVDSSISRGSDISDDVSAYDLILKDKERLLSFEEPTRFIFSHSALREGWDNPNVFQICTLKHSSSNIQRRQEVGRGLRLCVNKLGERMDSTISGFDVHSINKLTVVANDSYEDFVKGLQTEYKENLHERPTKLSKEFFAGKTIIVDGQKTTITEQNANTIYKYLIKNDYIDNNDQPTERYLNDAKQATLAPLPTEIAQFSGFVEKCPESMHNPKALDEYITKGNVTRIRDNGLNNNFNKREFQALWKLINHKYAYTVDFDSNELIKNSIKVINNELYVTKLTYTVSTGEQKDKIDVEQLNNGVSFNSAKTETIILKNNSASLLKYDILGRVAEATTLTRKTVASILNGIDPSKFILFQANPEEFIIKVAKIINSQKASLIVEHISYNEISETYDSAIFNESKSSIDFEDAFKAQKHVKDYVFVDGINKKDSVERRFAQDMDNAEEVCVYAKLPRGFTIPTPMGNYSPDWAIAFKQGTVKHVFFVAETKGSLNSLDLRPIENAKIDCAKKLFKQMSSNQVRYENVTSYCDLMDKMSNS